eukprot:c27348_g1_i3 orf=318-1163(-)
MDSARWWTKDTVAVVTGSNKGIGFEIVKQLAKEGLTVVLTARNEERGHQAVEKLKQEGLHVAFYPLDVCSTESISNLADWLKKQYGGLDILVNNAAIADFDFDYEMAKSVMETNYEGVKKVTKGLLPVLKASPAGARIVNVSSGLGKIERLGNQSLEKEISNVDSLTPEKVDHFVQRYLEDIKNGIAETNGWPTKYYPSYSLSKVVLNAYTRLLAKSLENLPNGEKVYVNCMAPGFVKTDLNRNTGILTPEVGADTAVWLALLPPGGPTGQFFYQRGLYSF